MENKVREIREDIGMTVSELARRSHTTRQTIHAIEDRKRKSISGELMFNIADALKTPVRDIFFKSAVTHEEHNSA